MSDAGGQNLPRLLRDTAKAIRPMIEESLQLRDDFAAYRTSITEAGGDWMALKALVKAQVEDEREGKGEHTRVAKIIAKADASASYADILNLNENNSFTEITDDQLAAMRKVVETRRVGDADDYEIVDGPAWEKTHQHGAPPAVTTDPPAGSGAEQSPATISESREDRPWPIADDSEAVPAQHTAGKTAATHPETVTGGAGINPHEHASVDSQTKLAAADSTVAALSDDLEIPGFLRRAS